MIFGKQETNKLPVSFYTSSIQAGRYYSDPVFMTTVALYENFPQISLVVHVMRSNNPKLFSILALLFCITSDLWTKSAMINLLETGEKLSFAGEMIQVSLVKNHNGFLGVAASLPDPLRNGLLYGAVSLLLLACLAYLFASKPSHVTLPLLFVTGGGLSNLLDRIVHHGGVTDFLSIGVGPFQTGIFNLADVYILTGSAVLGYYFFSRSPSSQNPGVTG